MVRAKTVALSCDFNVIPVHASAVCGTHSPTAVMASPKTTSFYYFIHIPHLFNILYGYISKGTKKKSHTFASIIQYYIFQLRKDATLLRLLIIVPKCSIMGSCRDYQPHIFVIACSIPNMQAMLRTPLNNPRKRLESLIKTYLGKG